MSGKRKFGGSHECTLFSGRFEIITCIPVTTEAYLQAINDASDPEVIKTLKLLYTNHTRQGRELTRKMSLQNQESVAAEEVKAVAEPVQVHSNAETTRSFDDSSTRTSTEEDRNVDSTSVEQNMQQVSRDNHLIFDDFWDFENIYFEVKYVVASF